MEIIMADQQLKKTGAYVQTTDVFDSATIYSLDIHSDEFKEFLVTLRNSINNQALVLNVKESGQLPLTEFATGKLLFPNPALSSKTAQPPIERPVSRLVMLWGPAPLGGPLPAGGAVPQPHGITITSTLTFTSITGAASDTTGHTYIPLPYVAPPSGADSNISVTVVGANVVIDVGATNRSNFVFCG